jgi:hypothetical protein
VLRAEIGVTPRREAAITAAALLVAVLALHYDVVLLGRSLVHSNYVNPLDQRGLPQNYGEGMIPHTEWANRNLALAANLRDPATSWWQWEPSTQFLAHAIKNREWPFWDPYLGGGTPAMANLLPAFFFPPYTLTVALGGGSIGLRNAYFLLLLWAAGYCSARLLRRHEVGLAASIAGGAMVVTSGALNQNLGSIAGQIASCLPFALYATRMLLDRPDPARAAATALIYAAISLASLPPLLISVFGVTVLYGVVAIALGDCGGGRGRVVAMWTIAIAGSLGLVAFYFLPVAALMRAVPQVEPFYEGAGLESMPIVNALQLLSPTLMGGVEVYLTAPFVVPNYPPHIPYVGLACVVCAVIAAPKDTVRSRSLYIASAIAAALVLLKIFGIPPIQWIGLLPLLEHVHFAHYLGVVLGFLAAFLGAQGIDAILRGAVSRRRLTVAVLAAASFPLVLLAIAFRQDAFSQLGRGYWIRDWGLLTLVAMGVVLSILAVTRGARRGIVAACLVALSMFEGVYNGHHPKPRAWDVYAHPPPYLRLIRREAPFGRVLAFAVPVANVSGAFRAFGLNSLMTFTPPRMYGLYRRYTGSPAIAFLTAPVEIPPDAVLERANVQFFGMYSASRADVRLAEARGFAKRYNDGAVTLFERPTGPRFFFSSEYRVVPAGESLAAIATAPPREIVLEQPPAFSAAPNATGDPDVVVDDYRLNRIRLTVNAPRAGLVYASEAYFDGWSATVNGAAAPILAANHAFRAVEVPAGSTTVEFEYWPPGLTAGLRISLTALTIVLALALGGLRHSIGDRRSATAD